LTGESGPTLTDEVESALNAFWVALSATGMPEWQKSRLMRVIECLVDADTFHIDAPSDPEQRRWHQAAHAFLANF
jgi:hypothetical protein